MAKAPAVRNTKTQSNDETVRQVRRILGIFVNSQAAIRPHFIVTGPSGSGKSHLIQALADELKLGYMEINAAQLTKEGTSGNSLSKALAPLLNRNANAPMVCFVDEFDKLFISGNTNSALAHETTLGVQNEFLKVLEGKKTSVYGDYGKYVDVPCDNVLFIFAGAFNGEENITIDRLREFGIKTEFLGRVGLCFGLEKITLEDMRRILEGSKLLEDYLRLFPEVKKDDVLETVMEAVKANFEKNTIGVRVLATLVHRYFIAGGKLAPEEVKVATFQTTMSLQ